MRQWLGGICKPQLTCTSAFVFFMSLMPDRSAVQGPVVQSIVSLTSSLRGQLVKCFTTL